MTAEIAILNKSAVALAADSAVTISAGSIEEKIFNTADKLFELSNQNPIGIMIYNDMSFMEAPLPLLIRKFRKNCSSVAHLEEAADAFLSFLNEFGKDCSAKIRERHIERLAGPNIEKIKRSIGSAMQKLIFDPSITPETFQARSEQAIEDIFVDIENATSKAQPASFLGHDSFELTDRLILKLKALINDELEGLEENFKDRLLNILKNNLLGDVLSPSLTGIVIAGFGKDDMFPTLVSYEIDGMVCGRLKYVRTHYVDIDRNVDPENFKEKAKVLPFAQREMVDRFLYGLDEEGQNDIEKFARTTISIIRKGLAEKYEFKSAEDKTSFVADIKELEDVFVRGLTNGAFGDIRNKSRGEIEDMVEFMPKPDLAHMAEALVQLTSIKRKVSRGMETVGGPIDVAIISQSEGFVWIKRKHYFPDDINMRYHARIMRTVQDQKEGRNGT